VSVSWNKTAPAPVALVNWVSFFFFLPPLCCCTK
jgi:hypothetical protein